jgi:amino acid adenylation domain-containing protein
VSQFSVLNKKPCKLEGPEMLHDLVLGFALEDRSAIEYYDARQASISLSYRDLGHRVSQLEGSIRGHLPKTKPGKRKVVPILIPQSPELYIAMLATLRTGCAFCPIQLDAPKERIEFIISDIDASLLLTISSVASRIEGIADLKILSVDAIAEKDPSETDAEIGEQSTISADGTAYVMYTSGSTGLPKGVPVSHRAATQSLLAHDRHIPKFSRFLQFAAPTFDVSIFEIFFTLYRRSTLIVCERSRLLNDLPGTMREMCVDAAELTPTVAGGLLRQRQNVPELKLLLTIGEMLTPQVVEEFGGDETKESLLWGMYGPTEAAIHCTVQPEFSAAYRPGNIGIPFDTVSAFIVPQSKPEAVDGHISEILPVGFVGELAVGGHQLADGYLNRDEQTSQVFVKTADYGMLYRTGDKARMLLDGTIECLGRISSGQVKLRGQRVELGEVRHAAAKTQGCMDAVVSVVDDNLIVFCLVEPHVKADDILTSCRNWLPTFMVPSDVVLLDDLPRLSSGKVDVKALSQNYKDNKALRASTTPDVLTPAEETFNTVLQSVFSLSIPIDAPLDMVGMDSLTAIKAASHLRHAGFDISMIDLLSSKTSRQLAQRQQPHENGQAQLHPAFQDIRQLAKQKLSPDEFDAVEEVFPCSPVQLAMLAETEKDPSAYCNWIEFEVNRALDRDQLVEHLQTLASKHRMLRSGFRQLNSTSHPYACITHKDLESDRISEVGAFKYHFSLEGSQLLHPVRVQTMSVQGTIRVLLQIHHSLYDGWSVDVLLRDWQQVLDGTQLQESPSFSQISNYHLRVDRTSALDYWQDHLSEFSRTSFPNFNGKRITSPSIEHESLALDADLGKLTRVSSELQISRAAVFQAALAQILGSYLSTEDVLIGTVASGRSLPLSGIEEIFGPCLATSPLRLNIDPSAKVIDLLRQVQELNKMIQQHAIVPAQMIKRICDFPPDTPLWDVLFVWQESLESRNTADYDVRILATEDRLECALTLEFEPRGDQIVGKATYHNDLLSREQVQLLFRQVDALVTGFLMNVNADIAGQDDWFSTETLSLSNPSPDLLRFDQGLEYTVEVHAAKNPHSLALVIATDIEQEHATIDSLTYKQLNDRTNQLAHFLRGKDLKSAELIAICMEKTADLYVAILAVLKLGLGYLPITPATPLKRIKTILDEAGVSLCLTHRDMFHSLALESVCEVLNVDTVNTALLPTTNLETPYNGSRAAYAVFTSGSTGIPKGVLVTQQNLKSNLAVLAELYPTTEKDRLLQSCSQAFDVSVFEIFFTWQQGMCLCTGSNDVLFRDLEMAVRSMNVTHLSLTPTVAALVDPNNTPKVKFLVTAGEGVTEKVKNLWSDRGLFQGYGPSETTNICTVKPRFSKGDAIRNIGPPFRNTSAFVFDPKADRLLPKGAVGELCFGGDQIYRGYINQPELTASKFIEHPTFGRLYRSGDSGRILPDGSIMFAARLDDQVKIRGQRVELHEISHCILTRADIVDCLTLAVETSADRKIAGLVSFIVPAELGHVQVELRDRLLVPMEQLPASFMTGMFTFLNESLPSYMVPTALIPIRAVPMTVQGKIDKRRLLAELDQLNEEDLIALSTHQQEQESGVMLSPIERVILAALEKTLNKSSLVIARGTSFFSFGLDSISAIAFSRHLSRTLDTKVAVSSVLRHSSVARLAHFLDAAHPHNEPSHIDANALPQDLIAHARNAATQAGVDIAKVLPCTPLQEAMLSSSSADSASYLNTTDLAICCDLARLKEAWVEMFRRHDTLRTTFAQTNNTLYPFLQLIIRETDIPWIDLTTNAAVAHSFPSAVGSFKAPVQITVFQQDDREYLRFVCHHALYDASALQILVKEIEAIYCQELLPPAPDATPFWQEIMEHRKDTHLNFWVDHLADFTPVILQTNGSTQEQITRISSLSLGALEDLSHKASQSLLAACQIAWARTLWALHDNPDVCFGNVVSGRVSLPEHLDNLVAPTFNTIPFRMNLGQHSNCASAMRAAQRINAASITHQYSPLRMIVSRVGHAEGGIFSSILLLQSSHLELDTNIWSIEHEHGVMDVSGRHLSVSSMVIFNNRTVPINSRIDTQ